MRSVQLMSDTLAQKVRDSREMMGSVWFQPDILDKYKMKVTKTVHSIECKVVGGDEWRLFLDYDLVAQDAILACKHNSHDSVKFIFKQFSDAPMSKRIGKGRLF